MDLFAIQWLTVLATHAELMANSYQALTARLEADLLDRVRKMPPSFFEGMMIDMLLRLGYGRGQRRRSDGLATAASTASSRKMRWGWTQSTCR